ncbi:hypothetical protein LJC20_07355 [Eubacteriales bacterium OttesenSCG-928-M02]|nr:hypothetical protein [Eubacteriales bacterium OttesenSCG-928-M02]
MGLTMRQEVTLEWMVEMLEGRGMRWALTGSASFSLQGMDMQVNDIVICRRTKQVHMKWENCFCPMPWKG